MIGQGKGNQLVPPAKMFGSQCLRGFSRYVDMVGVTGSIPVAPTIFSKTCEGISVENVMLFWFIEPRSSNSSAPAAFLKYVGE
jgi:hypothetical protein